MDIYSGKSGQGRPDHSASGTVLLDSIVLKDALVSSLYGGSGFKLILESLRISRNRSKHSRVKIGLKIYSFSVI